MDYSLKELLQLLESTWGLAVLIVTATFAGFRAWHKFYSDYWALRKLHTLSKLSGFPLNSDEEYEAFEQLKEEERFRQTFGRPSTPKFRELVRQNYAEGLFTQEQFRLARIYFNINDKGTLEVKFGKLEIVSVLLYLISLGCLALALFVFTYTLLEKATLLAYCVLLGILVVFIPAFGFTLKEILGLLTAQVIQKELKKRSPKT